MPAKRRFSSLDAAEARRLLRERTGRSHALLAGRGATAIWATLRALDLHNAAVLLPANTCYIVLWAVLQSGNQPFLVDIDPNSANISLEQVEQFSAAKPAVIIPAHMYGFPAPMSELTKWASARGVFVIEDAALALGTTADGNPAGSWGDVSIFSFGSGKTADAGAGGALLTDDARLAAGIERLLADAPLWSEPLQALNRQWLEIYWALHHFEADNPRLSEIYPTLFSIYGAITRCRLDDRRDLRSALLSLDANLEHRAALAALYDERLAAAPVRLLRRPAGTALWRYPLLAPREHRDALLESLWEAHVFEATRWYPSLQPMRRALAPDLLSAPTPAADQFAAEIVNLPLAPETDRARANQIAEIILSYFDAL